MFQGFKTPLVMVSSPEVIRALYSERRHNLPPGRIVTLGPLVGARSLLLLEGSEHLSRRKVMLPPFHGDRMRAYEPVVLEAAERELDDWPIGVAFPVHPSMQAITLAVILRAVFGVSERGPLHDLLRDLLSATVSTQLQVSVLFGRTQAARAPAAAGRGDRHAAACARSPRGAARRAVPTSARCSSPRASRTGARWTTARSATS